MATTTDAGSSLDRLTLLSDQRRRQVLAVLDEHPEITVPALARRVIRRETGSAVADERERVVSDLYHAHLPALEEVGALALDAEALVITRRESPLYDAAFLESDVNDAVFDALAEDRQRTILAVLDTLETDISRTGLATYVAAAEEASPLVAISETEHEQVEMSLHHVHLPRLAEAELITYDRDTGDVSLDDSILAPVFEVFSRHDNAGDPPLAGFRSEITDEVRR